ncbi:MAG: DUF2934 domain-containing protein [Candidatus Sulfotelmatobacter sp.]
MARSKSIPESKTTANKEQTVAGDGVSSLGVKSTSKEMPAQESRPASAVEPQARLAPESKAAKQVKAEPRKLEVMKNESRKNLVPINLEDEIRQRAFELYQQRGSRPGSEAEDWLAAEEEIRRRYRQQSA